MTSRFAKSFSLILLTALASSAVVQPARSETIGAHAVKTGEFARGYDLQSMGRSAVLEALTLFILTSGTLEQRTLALETLARDPSPLASKSLLEIIDSTPHTLLKKRARALLAARDSKSIQTTSALEAMSKVDLTLLQQSLVRPAVSELENGSRYVIQTWFLKKLLSVQSLPIDSRLAEFDRLVNDVNVYLSRRPEELPITTEAELNSFKARLTSRFAYLHDEMSFSKGLKLLRPLKLRVSPNMVAAVQAFSESFRSMDQRIEQFKDATLFDLLSDVSGRGLLFRLGLKSLSSEDKKKKLTEVANAFQTQADSLKTIAPKLLEQKAIQFSNPAEQRFFELLISHYFSTFTFSEAADMMKAMIERPYLKTGPELFNVMVMYAGPQMQKLLQVVGRRPEISPELGAIFQKIEDSGLASPWERVGANFEKPPVGTEWVSIDRDAKVGSMAEVYSAVVKYPNGQTQRIAARTLKSDIQERVEKEVPRLVELGRVIDTDPLLRSYNFPLVGPVMDDVMAMARNELDVAATIDNQVNGKRLYSGTVKLKGGIEVIFSAPPTLKASNRFVMYSDWLEGGKFETFVKRDPVRARIIAEATAEHWLENALFKEMFFHADMHQGNLKIRELSPGRYEVGLLDFGMVGRIGKLERSLLIRLSLATMGRLNPGLISRYLFDLSSKAENKVTLERLTVLAAQHIEKNKATPQFLTTDMWLAWSMSQGLKLPRSMTAFSRGAGSVEMLTQSSGSDRRLVDILKTVALKHKTELAPDLWKYLGDRLSNKVEQTRARFNRETDADPTVSPARPRLTFTCESVFGN